MSHTGDPIRVKYQHYIKNEASTKNFRFSDNSSLKYETSQKRYEIDVIGIYQNYILIIDAKQWKRKDSYGAMNKAANLQYQRVIALKKNPETFADAGEYLRKQGRFKHLKDRDIDVIIENRDRQWARMRKRWL